MTGLEITKDKDIFKVTDIEQALKSCPEHPFIGVVIHHADCYTGDDTQLVFQISDWHKNDNKWKMIGYAMVVERDGTIYFTNRLLKNITQAQAIGDIDGMHANDGTIGICLSLQGEHQDMTKAQSQALMRLIYGIGKRYTTIKHGYIFSHAVVQGNKKCPGWRVQKEFGVMNQFLDDGISNRGK